MYLRPLLPLTLMLLFACGGVEPSGLAGDPTSASASVEAVELAALNEAALVPMTPCPTSGEGALLAPAACVVFTPAEAGSGPDGENADSPQYALEPAGAARGQLLVYLNAICSAHAAVWQAMGMDPGRQDDAAAACSGGAHGGPIFCTENYPRWVQLLE